MALPILFILFSTVIPLGNSYFSPHFNRFLSKLYTPPGQLLLERPDFGALGSFGGRHNASHTAKNQPVVIVHGVTNTANTFQFVRRFLFAHGYSDADVYATTWGEGDKKWVVFVKLHCQYVKQVRALMLAVHNYTDSKIDVLAYSMGSPIARKAILGGRCGDEDLGPSIGYIVDTYVGVAGANYGSSLCVVPWFVCSKRNGLHCKSKFLKDLNSQEKKYEGEYSFAIYSEDDNKVGINCCGKNCSSIPYSNEEFRLKGFDHDQVMVASLDKQLSLIRNHHVK